MSYGLKEREMFRIMPVPNLPALHTPVRPRGGYGDLTAYRRMLRARRRV